MIADRLKELGIVLPIAAVPAFQYVPVTIHERLAFVSGQLPRDGDGIVTGKVGTEVDLDRGRTHHRACGPTGQCQRGGGGPDHAARHHGRRR